MTEPAFVHALVAGGGAGLSVDIALFPIDTVKTRLQSPQGFWKSGGFRGIYAGIAPVAAGSVPGAALFFCTYETVKKLFKPPPGVSSTWLPLVHMAAASCGEVVACLIRVPCEVVKQRAQASPHLTTRYILSQTFKDGGLIGFYRGYLSTVLREIPFSLMQFPLWEYFKTSLAISQGSPCEPWQSAVSGAVAGAIASGLTTPLDVAKTRIMLAPSGSIEARGSIFLNLKIIYKTKGISGLFAGVVPRVLWISIGGAIFLGVYDEILLRLASPEGATEQ